MLFMFDSSSVKIAFHTIYNLTNQTYAYVKAFAYIFAYLLTVGLWVASYFKLKETEI